MSGCIEGDGVEYYGERARGGTGMLNIGFQIVTNKTDPFTASQYGVGTPLQEMGWARLCDRVHGYGTSVMVQLSCGLEAARVAALKGHKVTLYEKSGMLGGQLIPASAPSFKSRLSMLMDYYKVQMKKPGVEVVLNHEITADSPELKDAYKIIVAIGATGFVPPIPGAHGPNVLEVIDAHTGNPDRIGQRVLVAGGGPSGCDCAIEMAMKGKEVTLVEMMEEIYPTGTLGNRFSILCRMGEEKITVLTGAKVKEFNAAGARVETAEGERVLEADTVERIKDFAPDVVLLAAGFDMVLPESVRDGLMVMDHMTALKRKREFRSLDQWHKKVVIYGFFAAEFALDLASEGCDVTLMGPGGDNTIAAEAWVTRERKMYLRRKLTDVNYIRASEGSRRVDNPVVYTHAKLEGVGKDGVRFYHNGIHKTMPYDVLIVSGGRKKNDEMFEEIQRIVPAVIKIGDCDKPGMIKDAIITANMVVRKL